MRAARQGLTTEPLRPQPPKGIFFNMETNYLEQIEEALINAAIEKQIHLERRACECDGEYTTAIENLLRYKKRAYWIQRGIQLFSDDNKDTFGIIF